MSHDPALLFAASLLDVSALECLTDENLLCTDEQHNHCIVIQLSNKGTLAWDYRMPEHGTPTDEWHGLTVTWTLPVNVRAEPLYEFLAEHLNLLERVYFGHTVVWDGNNHVGMLDDDGTEAAQEFSAKLEAWVQDSTNFIELVHPADWFEGLETALYGLNNDELEDLVREAIHDGDPFHGAWPWSWVVVNLDEALAYAREVRDDAAALDDE